PGRRGAAMSDLSIPPELRARWEVLVQQPLAPLEVLRDDLEAHLQHARGHGAADPRLLEGIASGALALLDGLGAQPAEEQRRLVQAAIAWFLLEDDEVPDLDSPAGLDDDAAVFNAVARH